MRTEEARLRALLERHQLPEARQQGDIVQMTYGRWGWSCVFPSAWMAEMLTLAVNAVHGLLQEVQHLRAHPKAGTLPWAVASHRPFCRPCWGGRYVCEARVMPNGERRIVAYPPNDRDFWYDLHPGYLDAIATDYQLL